MYEIFSNLINAAAFFALHGLIVLGLILIGLALNSASEHYLTRQKQKALQIIHGVKRR